MYDHDTEGRLVTVKEGDFDSSVGTGGACFTSQVDSMEHTYSEDGRLLKTEWKDESGTVTRRQESTYQADRRLKTLVNPVATSYARTFYYDDDGVPSKVEFEDFSSSAAKTEWDVDDLNRTTAMRRYTTAADSEGFTLTPASILNAIVEILDPLSHDMDLV